MNSYSPKDLSEDSEIAPTSQRGDAVCVVMNPGSGKKQAKPAPDELQEMMTSSFGRPCTIKKVSRHASPTELAGQALDEGYGTIIAAGGDGTIAGVASSLVGTDVTMGVLPFGTFNYFARGLQLPQSIPDAVQSLGRARVHPIHVGEINGRLFLNNASLGIYPNILKERETLYSKWGRSRITAYWSVLLGLAGLKRPYEMHVTVDGNTTIHKHTALAFVANSAFQLDAFNLEGAEDVRDGKLALYLTNATRWRELSAHAINLLRGQTQDGREFELVSGEHIRIKVMRKSKMLVARDGEKERMSGPYDFVLRRRALNVLIPIQE